MIEEIFSDGTKRYVYASLASTSHLEVPFFSPFAVLIWTSARSLAELRQRVCEQLIAAGCRHVIAAGIQAEERDTSADLAFVKLFPDKATWDLNFVMTSSHRDESIEDVAFKFVVGTNFDHHYFTNFFLLHFGDDPAAKEALVKAVRKEAKAAAQSSAAG